MAALQYHHRQIAAARPWLAKSHSACRSSPTELTYPPRHGCGWRSPPGIPAGVVTTGAADLDQLRGVFRLLIA
jgi:hypothetical protein